MMRSLSAFKEDRNRAWQATAALACALAAAAGFSTTASGQESASAAALGTARQPGQKGILREIDDPQNGARWLLVRDPQHPGGPGRFILASASARLPSSSPGQPANAPTSAHPPTAPYSGPANRPILRAGDRLVVEEHTAILDASLEATALAPATVGSVIDVRLKIGGTLLRALITGPGRGVLQQAVVLNEEARR